MLSSRFLTNMAKALLLLACFGDLSSVQGAGGLNLLDNDGLAPLAPSAPAGGRAVDVEAGFAPSAPRLEAAEVRPPTTIEQCGSKLKRMFSRSSVFLLIACGFQVGYWICPNNAETGDHVLPTASCGFSPLSGRGEAVCESFGTWIWDGAKGACQKGTMVGFGTAPRARARREQG